MQRKLYSNQNEYTPIVILKPIIIFFLIIDLFTYETFSSNKSCTLNQSHYDNIVIILHLEIVCIYQYELRIVNTVALLKHRMKFTKFKNN